MQLVITAPAPTTDAPAPDITWLTKGRSSTVSHDGRWALRKNSKGVWKIVDGGDTIRVDMTKEDAKALVAKLVASEAAPTTDVKAALVAGEAKVYSLRANGTMRRRHFLTGEALLV